MGVQNGRAHNSFYKSERRQIDELSLRDRSDAAPLPRSSAARPGAQKNARRKEPGRFGRDDKPPSLRLQLGAVPQGGYEICESEESQYRL